jgi:hypothetical protein
MPTAYLSIYKLKVNVRRRTDQLVCLNNATGGILFGPAIHRVLAEKKLTLDAQNRAVVPGLAMCTSLEGVDQSAGETHVVEATLIQGNSGQRYEVHDHRTGQRGQPVEEHHSLLHRHEVIFALPRTRDHAWIAISHIDRPAGFSDMTAWIREAFQANGFNNDFVLKIEAHSNTDVLNSYYTSLRAQKITYQTGIDMAARLHRTAQLRRTGRATEAPQRTASLDVILRSPRNSWLALPDQWFVRKAPLAEMLRAGNSTIPIPSDESIRKITVQGKVEGDKARTFVVGQGENSRTYMKLDGTCIVGGTTSLARVKAEALQFIASIPAV